MIRSGVLLQPLATSSVEMSKRDKIKQITPRTKTEKLLHLLYRSIVTAGVKMILTQTEDLIDEDSFLRDSFLNQDKPVTRVGVFEEDFASLKSGLDAFMSGEGVSSSNLVVKKEIPFEDPRSESKSRGEYLY